MTIVGYIITGLLVGLVSGTLGIGGGVLLIPILMSVFGFEQRQAIGTTLGVLVMPVLLFAAWRYHQNGWLNIHAALWIALGFAAGSPLGAEIVVNLPDHFLPVLRIFFGLMLIYIGVRYLLVTDNDAASAFLGLLAVGLSLAAYLLLRALGRRYPSRKLGDEIDRCRKAGPNEPDYYI